MSCWPADVRSSSISSSKNNPTSREPAWLPVEQTYDISSRQLSTCLVLATMGFVALNLLVGWYAARYPLKFEDFVVVSKWDEARSSTPASDWVVVGDSAGLHGVDPDVITEVTGASAVNLCTIGSLLAVDDVLLLTEYIRNHGVPKTVVMVHAPDVWPREVKPSFYYWMARSGEDIDPDSGLVGFGLSDRLLWAEQRLLPGSGRGRELAQRLMAPGTLMEQEYGISPGGLMRLDEDDARPDKVRNTLDGFMITFEETPDVSPANRASLDAMIDLSKEHGFRLIVANSPLSDVVASDPGFRKAFSKIDATLHQAIDNEPGVSYVMQDFYKVEPELLEDHRHVVGVASARYTRALCEEIAGLDRSEVTP